MLTFRVIISGFPNISEECRGAILRHPAKLLLLGSGELGKELTISAQRLGCHIVACDNYPGAPAHQVADGYEIFDMLDPQALKDAILKHSPDIIIPEIEAIRTETLFEFERMGIQVVPSASAVNYTMNRDRIRDLVSKELGIRTAKFSYAESLRDCREEAERIGYPVVMKPVMSSSGKGQTVIESSEGIEQAWLYACSGMRGDRERVILEEFINFDYEITLLTVQQKLGPTIFCEPIGHRQEFGDYRESWQPCLMKDNLLKDAQDIAQKVTSNLGGYGIFGVEFFITDREVIFSELSPRPHDTGMVTLISQQLNEFDLHLRAILGFPIPNAGIYGPSASAVVLADRVSQSFSYEGIDVALEIPGVDVRIFGKPSTRINRRMAVCLATASTLDIARQNAAKASSLIRIKYDN